MLTESDNVPDLNKVILFNSFHTFFLWKYLIPFTPKAGAVNSQSRPQSHSSGEFSLLHEHEAWSSSGSSPIQYLKGHTRSSPVLQQRTPETLDSHGKQIKTGSPGSEVVTLQQFLEESNKSTSSEVSFKNILTTYYPIYGHRINRRLIVSRIALKLYGDIGYTCIKQ